MIEQKFCEVCQKPMEAKATGRPRRTCNAGCRQKAYRQRVKARTWKQREDGRAIREGRRIVEGFEKKYGRLDDSTRFRLSRGIPVLTCRNCGKPYVWYGVGPVPKGCSEACKQALRDSEKGIKAAILKALEHDQEKIAGALEGWLERRVVVRLCRRCRRPFLSTGRRGPKPNYCSKRCATAHWRERQRICPVCGKRFDRMDRRQVMSRKYCSEGCCARAQVWKRQEKKGAQIRDGVWRGGYGRGARRSREAQERMRALDHQMKEREWQAAAGNLEFRI